MAEERTINLNVNTKDAQKNVKDLEKAVEGVNEEVKETTESSSELTGQLDNLTGGAISKFKSFKTSLKGVTGGFKTMRAAIISTGIGALIIAITSLIAAFRSSEEGQNKFAKLTSMIGTVVSVLTDRLADLGEGIINAFTNPVEAIKNFAKSVKSFITDRINGIIDSFGLLGSAIKKAFTGDFSGALEDAKDGFVKLNNSINPVAIVSKALVKSTKELVKEMKEEAKIAGQIADIRAEADKLDRKLIVDRAKADRDRATLLEQSVNKEKFSVEERIGFLQEAADLEEKITNQEIEAAQKRLDAQRAENALGKSTKEDKEKEAQLEAQLIQLETAKLTKQKEVTSQIIAFKAEEAAQLKAIADQKAAEDKERADKEALEKKERDAKALEEQKKLDEQIVQAQQNLEQAKANAIQGGLQVIGMLAGKSKAVAKTLLIVEKGLAIAQVISTASKAIAQAKANLAATPAVIGLVPNPAYVVQAAATAKGILSTKIAAATSVATIAAQAIQGLGGGGGGGSAGGLGGGGATESQPPSFNIVGQSETNQLAEAVAGQEQQPVQAYVVANDVTTAQSLENNIVEGATLG
jgi:hypothetical protein